MTTSKSYDACPWLIHPSTFSLDTQSTLPKTNHRYTRDSEHPFLKDRVTRWIFFNSKISTLWVCADSFKGISKILLPYTIINILLASLKFLTNSENADWNLLRSSSLAAGKMRQIYFSSQFLLWLQKVTQYVHSEHERKSNTTHILGIQFAMLKVNVLRSVYEYMLTVRAN